MRNLLVPQTTNIPQPVKLAFVCKTFSRQSYSIAFLFSGPNYIIFIPLKIIIGSWLTSSHHSGGGGRGGGPSHQGEFIFINERAPLSLVFVLFLTNDLIFTYLF